MERFSTSNVLIVTPLLTQMDNVGSVTVIVVIIHHISLAESGSLMPRWKIASSHYYLGVRHYWASQLMCTCKHDKRIRSNISW